MDEKFWSHIAMIYSSDVCYISDVSNDELVYLNENAKQIFNINENNYLGRKYYELLPHNPQSCDFETTDKPVQNKFYEWEYYHPILEKTFQLKDKLIYIEDKLFRIEFASDITDSKDHLINLEHQLEIEMTLVQCAQTLSEQKDMATAINLLLETICKFYHADRAYIFENCADGLHMDNTYEWNSVGIEPQIDKLQEIPLEFVQYWFDRFRDVGEFFITSLGNEVDTDSETYQILNEQGIESLSAAPLMMDDNIIGFLGVDNPRIHTNDTALLRSLGLFITNDLDKQKLLSELDAASNMDVFTSSFNRNKYMKILTDIVDNPPESIGIIYLDINGLKEANDLYGHKHGDELILELTNLVKVYFPNSLYRIGGDEFVVLYMENNQADFQSRLADLSYVLTESSIVSISLGHSWCADPSNIATYITIADKLMYQAKQEHYSKKQFSGTELYHNKPATISAPDNALISNDLPTVAMPTEQYNIHLAAFNNTIIEISRIIYSSTNIDHILQSVMGYIGHTTMISRISICQLVNNGTTVSTAHEWCAEGISSEMNILRDIRPEMYTEVSKIFQNNNILVVNNVDTLSGSYAELQVAQGVKATLQAVVIVDPSTLLLVKFDDCLNAHPWSQGDIALLQYFTNLLAIFEVHFKHTTPLARLSHKTEVYQPLNVPVKEKLYANVKTLLTENPTKQFLFILLNIDKFQRINSLLGMAEGDRLLHSLASDLPHYVTSRQSVFGHINADIFCICEEITTDIDTILQALIQKTQTLLSRYRADYNLSISIGAYEIKHADMTVEEMYSKAFLAAKTISHLQFTGYVLYNESIEHEDLYEQAIINDVYPALRDGQFAAFLQPKINLITNKVVGAEALIRWKHPKKGYIAPIDFIPILEQNGLITIVDLHVWDMVFRYIHGQKMASNPIVPISINVSRIDLLNKNLIDQLKHLLEQYDVDVKYVHIEITEGAYSEHHAEILSTVTDLKSLGFHIEMDDFGAGYSSLNMFSEMIVDTLKLDMNFLRNLEESDDNSSILTFIIDLAKHFNIPVIAEGIETEAQCIFLKKLGCEIGQGYYFAKPMEMSVFTEFLKADMNIITEHLPSTLSISAKIHTHDASHSNINNFFSTTIDAAGIFDVSDSQIKLVRCNDAYCNILNIDPDYPSTGVLIETALHPDDLQQIHLHLKSHTATNDTTVIDARILDFLKLKTSDTPSYNKFRLRLKLLNHIDTHTLYVVTLEKLADDAILES